MYTRILGSICVATLLASGCGTQKKEDMDPMPMPMPMTKDLVDTAIQAGSFKTLVSAVQAAGLEQTLRGKGPYTVFAPTDAAFEKIPSFLLTKLTTAPYKTSLSLILKYHVLGSQVKAADIGNKKLSVDTASGLALEVDGSSGKVVLDGSAKVSMADIGTQNGVIHVIDGVLLPNLVQTAIAYDDGKAKFSTLVTAVKAAGLVETLSGPGPFTVFAPTDAAFDALKTSIGEDAFKAILADKDKLTKILTYHVVGASVYAKDVAAGEVATVQGGKLKIKVADGKVAIGDSTNTDANVVFTDVPSRNGVIHVIDKVLLPPLGN